MPRLEPITVVACASGAGIRFLVIIPTGLERSIMGSFRMFSACLGLIAACAMPAPAGAASAPLEISDTASPPVVTRTSAACTLEPGPIETAFSYAWPTPDAFRTLAWRIPRASCTACAPNVGLAVKTVSFRVRWFGPCAANAEVSVVGVTGPPGCRVPDPAQVLCGPASYVIVGFTSAGAVHTLDVPVGCCVGPEAFVLVRFTGLDACYPSGSSPGLTRTSAACVNCTEDVATTVSHPALTDWCSLTTNSIWLQVEADCCGAVGVEGDPGTPPRTGISILATASRQVHMRISLAGAGRRPVELAIFDIAGRRVRELMRSDLDPGNHLVDWDGTSSAGARLPAGVYKLRLVAGGERAVATAILLD
jgi:hypothetical protein